VRHNAITSNGLWSAFGPRVEALPHAERVRFCRLPAGAGYTIRESREVPCNARAVQEVGRESKVEPEVRGAYNATLAHQLR
jgi:hypothetical protein